MGIFCQINLFKPSDGAYQPGQLVTGIIKYAVDEPLEVEKITTSLKGAGLVLLEVRHYRQTYTYKSTQIYVDIDNVIQETKGVVPIGSYDIKFAFILPSNIPSSVYYRKHLPEGTLKCSIKYYIRIKFERPGIFAFNKHFKKEITVITGATPKLLREPVVYGETKNLMQFFSSTPNIVNIKATIFNSVIPIGGKINLHYDVENNSNVVIKSVESKLIERYRFKAKGHPQVKKDKTVPGTDAKTSSVGYGKTQSMELEMSVPSDRHSLENSDIVSREYLVRIEAALPIPHRNTVLDIPIQIEIVSSNPPEYMLLDRAEGTTYDYAPPTYWEAMGEARQEDDDMFAKEK